MPGLVLLGEEHAAVDDRGACRAYSKTVMLRPISPSPPSGVMRRARRGFGAAAARAR